MKRAIVLNDTSFEGHHGCTLVMRTLAQQLRRRGIEIVATSRSGRSYRQSRSVEQQLPHADLLIVNGEGTIHHDAPLGHDLLTAGKSARALGIPACLINTTFDGNSPAVCAPLLADFALVAVRESRSRDALAQLGISAKLTGDLTFSADDVIIDSPDAGRDHSTGSQPMGFTDSVLADVTCALRRMAESHPDGRYLPMHFASRPSRAASGSPSLARTRRAAAKVNLTVAKRSPAWRHFLCSRYRRRIAQLGSLVTGRFHAACFALQLGVPFVTLPSNSHKVEGLLEDIGIVEQRLVKLNEIETIRHGVRAFSADESDRIRRYVINVRQTTSQLFDAIASSMS